VVSSLTGNDEGSTEDDTDESEDEAKLKSDASIELAVMESSVAVVDGLYCRLMASRTRCGTVASNRTRTSEDAEELLRAEPGGESVETVEDEEEDVMGEVSENTLLKGGGMGSDGNKEGELRMVLEAWTIAEDKAARGEFENMDGTADMLELPEDDEKGLVNKL
jgi:hypothetical protein